MQGTSKGARLRGSIKCAEKWLGEARNAGITRDPVVNPTTLVGGAHLAFVKATCSWLTPERSNLPTELNRF